MMKVITMMLLLAFSSSQDFFQLTEELRYLANDSPGALAGLQTTYTPKGRTDTLTAISAVGNADLPVYLIGEGKLNAIVVAYDIYGFSTLTRTKQVCDKLAEAGYFVIMPDFFRGTYSGQEGAKFDVSIFTWDKINDDLTKKVYPYIEGKGITRYTMVGFCWGGWVVWQACANNDKLKAGVSYHPAFTGRNIETVAPLLKSPQFVVATMNEDANIKEGGSLTAIVMKNFPTSNFTSYNDMTHGFVTRGDLTIQNINATVTKVLAQGIDFIKRNDPVVMSAPPLPTTSGHYIKITFIFALIALFLF
jgi:dienelactone hydrolase